MQTTYTVPGMTCDHCRIAVSSEIAAVSGVGTVDVDLDAKRVTVTGPGFDDRAVRDAIDLAGYDVA